MNRYVLVEIEDERPMPLDTDWAFAVKISLGDAWFSSPHTFRTADVTDIVTYNKHHASDPWDKPYPAMYENMMERLS